MDETVMYTSVHFVRLPLKCRFKYIFLMYLSRYECALLSCVITGPSWIFDHQRKGCDSLSPRLMQRTAVSWHRAQYVNWIKTKFLSSQNFEGNRKIHFCVKSKASLNIILTDKTAKEKTANKMSMNTAHANNGVLLHAGER